MHSQIQFTREREKDNRINFLDVLGLWSKKESSRHWCTGSPLTHIGRSTLTSPHHHPRVKTGTVKVCGEGSGEECGEENTQEERDNLHQNHLFEERVFKAVGLTDPRHHTPLRQQTLTTETEGTTTTYRACWRNSRQRARRLAYEVITNHFQVPGNALATVKTKDRELKRKEIVYKISCRDSDAAYVPCGNREISAKEDNGAHAWDNGHRPDWDAAETMENEPHYRN